MPKSEESGGELSALQTVIRVLQDLDGDARERIFEAAATFLQIRQPPSLPQPRESAHRPASGAEPGVSSAAYPSFSSDTDMSPKEFLYQKQPRTDVERIAALAFYLSHYRDTLQFRTLDLSKLNTEAAQPKFSNAASSANNAVKQGYLVPTTKGQRQLSAAGERFVAALPDREAARAAMTTAARRKRTRRAAPKKSTAASG
jgi:hypothetical protein